MRKNPIRYVWMALGILCLVLGTIGVVLPILPTVPFFLLTLFAFHKVQRAFMTGLPVPIFTKRIWNPM